MNLPACSRWLREALNQLLLRPLWPQQDEDTIGLLSEKVLPPASFCRGFVPKQINRLRGAVIALAGISLLFLGASGSARRYRYQNNFHWAENLARISWTGQSQDHYLHVVIAAEPSYVELCKTMLSGFVLSYPSPWVAVPKSTRDEHGRESSAVVRKLESILEFLEHENGSRDNDTAIILGNSYTWFQVRPEVLLKRYMDIQRRHELMLLDDFGPKTVAAHRMKPKVLFASHWTFPSSNNTAENCLPIQSTDGSPRYLSHDLVIGLIKDLTPLYQYALDQAIKLNDSIASFDEHTIFSDMFRAQQLHRQSLAKLGEEVHDAAELDTLLDEHDVDFGISLDMDSDLRYHLSSSSTSSNNNNPHPSNWTRYDLRTDRHSPAFPKDIALSAPPYWTITGTLPSKTWEQVSLLSVFSNHPQIPALVQHDEFSSNDNNDNNDNNPYQNATAAATPPIAHSSQKWSQYPNLWFHPYGRALLDSEALTGIVPIARLIDPRTGIMQRFWVQGIGKASVKTAEVERYEWDDVCGDWDVAEEVFRDGKGPWMDPR